MCKEKETFDSMGDPNNLIQYIMREIPTHMIYESMYHYQWLDNNNTVLLNYALIEHCYSVITIPSS